MDQQDEKVSTLFISCLPDILHKMNECSLKMEPMAQFFLDESINQKDKLTFVEHVLTPRQRKVLCQIVTDYHLREHYQQKKRHEEENNDMSRLKTITRKRTLRNLYKEALLYIFNMNDINQKIKKKKKGRGGKQYKKLDVIKPNIIMYDQPFKYFITNCAFNSAHMDQVITHYTDTVKEYNETDFCSGLKTQLYHFEVHIYH